jgi:hypothetical protein
MGGKTTGVLVAKEVVGGGTRGRPEGWVGFRLRNRLGVPYWSFPEPYFSSEITSG